MFPVCKITNSTHTCANILQFMHRGKICEIMRIEIKVMSIGLNHPSENCRSSIDGYPVVLQDKTNLRLPYL